MFAFSSNLDAFVVGVSYGIKKIHIGFLSNLCVALIATVGTVLSMVIGISLRDVFPDFLEKLIGSGVIILIGCYCLLKFLVKKLHLFKSVPGAEEHPERYDWDHSRHIDLKEAVVLGLALTINNTGIGIGASITGLPIPLSTLCTFLLSSLFLYTGNKLGRGWLSRVAGAYAEPVAGLIMILLGIWQLFA